MYKVRLARLVAFIDHAERGVMRRADHMAPPFSFCRLFQAFLTRDVLDHTRAVVGEYDAVTILRRVQVYIRHDAEVAVAV